MAKDYDQDQFEEGKVRKLIQLISLTAVTSIGVWMVLTPEGYKHNSIEKGSVYLFKEFWSLEFGIIILAISIPFMVLTIRKYISFGKNIWYRTDSGYYLYINKKRSAGNDSTYQGKDLLVFHPESGNVYKLKNYQKASHGKFRVAVPSKHLSCSKSYWQADESGFYLFYNGKRLKENLSTKYDGDDLYVKAPDVRKSFKLPNYKNQLDSVLREAEVLN